MMSVLGLRPSPPPNTCHPPSLQRTSQAGSCRALCTAHLPICPGRPSLPGLSSIPAQGSEEEESCTSEITTSLSEEVLDLRGAERYQKGTSWVCRLGGVQWEGQMVFVHSPDPLGGSLWR